MNRFSYTSPFLDSLKQNPSIKKREVRIRTVKSGPKQYGDKGYMPSNGMGVGQ